MTDSTDESLDPELRPRISSQLIRDVNTLHTPVPHRFDPPLEHRPYEQILAEVRAASVAIEKRRFGRRKVK